MKPLDQFKFDVAKELVEEHEFSATNAMGLVSFYSLGVSTYGDVTGAVQWVLERAGKKVKKS